MDSRESRHAKPDLVAEVKIVVLDFKTKVPALEIGTADGDCAVANSSDCGTHHKTFRKVRAIQRGDGCVSPFYCDHPSRQMLAVG